MLLPPTPNSHPASKLSVGCKDKPWFLGKCFPALLRLQRYNLEDPTDFQIVCSSESPELKIIHSEHASLPPSGQMLTHQSTTQHPDMKGSPLLYLCAGWRMILITVNKFLDCMNLLHEEVTVEAKFRHFGFQRFTGFTNFWRTKTNIQSGHFHSLSNTTKWSHLKRQQIQ